MNILIYCKEEKDLKNLESNIKKVNDKYIIGAFDEEKMAKQYIDDNHIDVAFIDTCFIEIAKKLKKKNDHVNIIFMNNEDSYNKDTLSLKASAYLFKPVTLANIKQELNELRYPVKENEILLRVQCFGNFAVFKTSGEMIKFSRSKAKELFAYLIYKKGSDVTSKEIAAILFEDDIDIDKQMSYLHQIFYTLGKDLDANGAGDVIVKKYNSTSVDISKINCDYYRFNNDDKLAKRLYNGEFMMQYEWADYVTAYLDRNVD